MAITQVPIIEPSRSYLFVLEAEGIDSQKLTTFVRTVDYKGELNVKFMLGDVEVWNFFSGLCEGGCFDLSAIDKSGNKTATFEVLVESGLINNVSFSHELSDVVYGEFKSNSFIVRPMKI